MRITRGLGSLIAFPLFPPEQLKVEDAAAKLPSWLHALYTARYEAYHHLFQHNGTSWFRRPDFLNRILGLSNLYYIDPGDQEILEELREISFRRSINANVGRDELGRQFQSDFGDRFWAMAQSGIQKESLNSIEIQQRDAAAMA